MDDQSDDSSARPSRRALLAGASAAVGTALAGCSALSGGDSDARARVEELEAELDAARAENEALRDRVDELEGQLATCQRRLEARNVWGFSDATMDRLQDLAHTWTDSVVVIDALSADGRWHVGTGWVYDDGTVATNAHVVAPLGADDGSTTRYRVWDRDGDDAEGELLGFTYGRDEVFDRPEDIGFLAVPDSITDGRVMDHGVSRQLSPDEPLVQIGHPYSLAFWTPSVGPFVGHQEPFFASNVPGQPGVSGSPVLDRDGDVVGMTWGGGYVRRPQREADDAPRPGDGSVLGTFEEAVNGMHSYMHRIHAAADALV